MASLYDSSYLVSSRSRSEWMFLLRACPGVVGRVRVTDHQSVQLPGHGPCPYDVNTAIVVYYVERGLQHERDVELFIHFVP